MRNRLLLVLMGVFVVACASRPQEGASSEGAPRRLTVVQASTNSTTAWEACRECPAATEKRVVVHLPPPPVTKKSAEKLSSQAAVQTPLVAAVTPAMVAPTPVSERYTVHFSFGSARLDREAQRVLQAALTALSRPNVRADVLGRTDPRGSPRFNQALAIKRAQAVRDFLESNGVMASSIAVRAYDPCCDGPINAGEDEMRLRRRSDVEVVIEAGVSPVTTSQQTQARQHVRGK